MTSGGNGRDLIRAGYGRYYDVGYTNANILFAAINATGIGAGTVFTVTNAAGIRKADGTFFRVGDAISTIQSQNEAGGALPLNSHTASPRIRQPYSDQYSLGWSHQLDAATVIDIDYMHSEGRDLGWRLQLNHRNPGVGATGPRQFADLTISPANFTTNVSDGKSEYDGINFGVRRRMMSGLQFTAWYSLVVGEVARRATRPTSSTRRTSRTTWIRTRTCSSVRRAAATRGTGRRSSAVWNGTVGHQRVADLALPLGAAGRDLTDGRDLNANGVSERHPRHGVCLRRVRQLGQRAAQGDRRLRDDQLRPRREPAGVQPARVEGLPTLRHGTRSKRLQRCSTCSTR